MVMEKMVKKSREGLKDKRGAKEKKRFTLN
jgi:hypothetical protein